MTVPKLAGKDVALYLLCRLSGAQLYHLSLVFQQKRILLQMLETSKPRTGLFNPEMETLVYMKTQPKSLLP